jgi:hypothetical protein
MRGPADEVDGALAQRLVGFVNWEDELERNVEALASEESELNRSGSRKIRVRNEVGNGKLHCLPPPWPGLPGMGPHNRFGSTRF